VGTIDDTQVPHHVREPHSGRVWTVRSAGQASVAYNDHRLRELHIVPSVFPEYGQANVSELIGPFSQMPVAAGWTLVATDASGNPSELSYTLPEIFTHPDGFAGAQFKAYRYALVANEVSTFFVAAPACAQIDYKDILHYLAVEDRLRVTSVRHNIPLTMTRGSEQFDLMEGGVLHIDREKQSIHVFEYDMRLGVPGINRLAHVLKGAPRLAEWKLPFQSD
jgi:hypothetical protein